MVADTTQLWNSRHLSRRPAAFFGALILYIIVILVAAPQAQQPQGFMPAGTTTASVVREPASGTEIELLVGRSTVISVGSPIARVSLTVPDIADALVTSPNQLLIHGKKAGTISLFIWDRAGAIRTYEVVVRHDLSALKEQLRQLFPGEDITVIGSGKDVVVSGTVASKYVVEKAAEVAAGYVAGKDDVVNLLKQQEGVASNQVMLRVRFAEVSRSALQELGASFFALGRNEKWFGRTAPPGVPAPDFDSDNGGLVFSDFLNLFVFNSEEGLGGVVRALSNKGLFQSLAEPNLIATNGKEASFLAGGEYPYPVVQSGASTNSVTIQFKEFGVRLSFTPTVLGDDLIHLKVKPEVSSLDFANAVILDGFRVPAISTRRTETEVELRDGQTFAIAGLMNNTLTNSMSKIPGIGDIPILGLLFRSKAHQKNQTELVVMITPTIIRRGQMGVSEGLPTLVEPYLGRPERPLPNPDPYVGSPRYPVNQRPGGDADANPVQKPASRPAEQPRQVPTEQAPAKPQPLPSRTIAPQTQSLPAPPPQRPVQAPVPEQTASPDQTTTFTPADLLPGRKAGNVQSAAPEPAATPTPQPTFVPNSPAPPAMVPQPAPAPAAEPAPLTKEQKRAVERAQEQERRAAEAEAKQRAEAEKRRVEQAKRDAAAREVADRKAAEEKRQADKLAKERAKREAEIAKKNAELAKKKAEEDLKREKALAEAATRLKEAQAAYQSELDKAKGGSNDKPTAPGKTTSGSGSE